MGLNDPIMPPRVTAPDAYKPKHTDGELAANIAAAEARIWLEAARMAEEYGRSELKKLRAEAHESLFTHAARLRAKATEE